MIVVDTIGVLAAKDESHPEHAAVARTLIETTEDLVLSPFVLAECDYMLATRLGALAAREFLNEVTSGRISWSTSTLETLPPPVESSTATVT